MTSRAAHRSEHDSRGVAADSRLSRGVRAGRAAGLIAGLAGVAALVAATLLPVLRLEVANRIRPALDRSGWDLHGPALLLLAALALALLVLALRGSLPAALAVGAVGLAALGIAVLADLPDVGRTDLVQEPYALGTVQAGAGAFAEIVGGVLLLASGGALGFAAATD
jgi:hypothetical protein